MTTLDWVTIALYFGMLAGLTWWAVSRNRNTADDFFLAGRDLGWVVVGASIFASGKVPELGVLVDADGHVVPSAAQPGNDVIERLTPGAHFLGAPGASTSCER